MWDDDGTDSPVQTVSPVSSSQGNGFCVGRGRGFGNMSSLGDSLPQVGSRNTNNTYVNNDNSGWEEDSGWDEKPSSNNNVNTWQGSTSNSGSTWEGNKNQKSSSWNKNTDGSDSRSNRGSSSGCFKCGESGHMARECPSEGSKRDNSSSNCYNCGESGHMSRECPNERKKSSSSGCFNCGESGHMSRECPNPKKEREGGDRTCRKCGEEGHMARDCPSDSGGGGGNSCYNCGESGHMSRECPNPKKERGGGDRTCRKCGEEGHMARDCPSDGGNDSRKCYKCQQEGHMAKDCTNEESNVGPDGKPRAPLYIPPDPTDNADEMFEHVHAGINFSKYEKIPVDVSGNDVPSPISSFENAGLCQLLLSNVKRMGYDTPTPVQKYAIPIVLKKRDLMACAQTGSGKTAAFLLPMINAMINDSNLPNNSDQAEQCPLAVIISPTRELTIQIYGEARKFAYDSVVRAQVVYGGTSTGHQHSRIRRGCHILVATPGRLLDFVEKGRISFSQLRYLVLDEADRMLDMGFLPSVRKMVEDPSMPPKGVRQTLMFSATFPEEIQSLASEYLNDYLFLTVGRVGAANTDVEQAFFAVGQYDKRQKLMDILKESNTDRVLVFVEQKRTADFLASYLSQNDISTTSIHGDRLQREREEALRDFRSGARPVLVATAVAARGLDIKDVRHVVNYDLPQSIDEYVHRIGRTGRVGNLGKATSFYDSSVDQPLSRSLKKILMDAQQEIPDWLAEDAVHAVGTTVQGSRGFGGRDMRNQGGPRRSERSTDNWEDSPSSQADIGFSQPVEADENWD